MTSTSLSSFFSFIHYVHTYICTHIHTYVHTYTYVHTHTHIFLPSKPSHIPLHTLLQIHGLFFYVITCMYVYVYRHIPKYNLFSPRNVTCMYVFRAEHLALDKQLVCSSLGKTSSLAPSFPQFKLLYTPTGLTSHHPVDSIAFTDSQDTEVLYFFQDHVANNW